MHKFPHPVSLGEDAQTGKPIFGVNVNGYHIVDPTVSECGRFEVDPQETYGMSEADVAALKGLNNTLEDALQDALNAGCKTIQDALGVEQGDWAGLFFSGDERTKPLKYLLGQYMDSEIRRLQAQAE